MEHCKFRVMDNCKNEECELLMCMGTENCIHFQPESKEELEDTIPKWKIDKAIEEIENAPTFDYKLHLTKTEVIRKDVVLEILKRNIGE